MMVAVVALTVGGRMADPEFERKLKDDVPRGLGKAPALRGRDRGVRARWLPPEDMQGGDWVASGGLISDGLMLGRRTGRVIGWKDDRHVMLAAGSRSGKGVSLIVPNLLAYSGSALVIDPKGELAAITAGRRGKGTKKGGTGLGQDVHVLDPFGTSGCVRSSFNPLAELDADSPDVVDDSAMFAEALITHPERGEKHWTESAQALLQALILLVLREEPERRNLVTVRRLLTLTDDLIKFGCPPSLKKPAMEVLLDLLRAREHEHYGHICAGVAAQLENMGENERGSVLSAARTQTKWLDSAAIAEALVRSDFRLDDLKLKKATVYLCLPATRMGTYSRWLRLLIGLALTVMERADVDVSPPVLFVLDEFPVLGHMADIESAAGQMAGFGVKLWVVIQNVGQLKKHYDKGWETFFANSGVLIAFGNNDSETLTELSKMLGRTDIEDEQATGAVGSALLQGAAASREVRREVPLLAEHELKFLFARRQNRALVVTMENAPAVVERFAFYDDPLFAGLYDEKPKRAHPLPRVVM